MRRFSLRCNEPLRHRNVGKPAAGQAQATLRTRPVPGRPMHEGSRKIP